MSQLSGPGTTLAPVGVFHRDAGQKLLIWLSISPRERRTQPSRPGPRRQPRKTVGSSRTHPHAQQCRPVRHSTRQTQREKAESLTRRLLACCAVFGFAAACDECEEGELQCDGAALLACERPDAHVPSGPRAWRWTELVDCGAVGAACRIPGSDVVHPRLSDVCVFPDVQCSADDASVCVASAHESSTDPSVDFDVIVTCEGPFTEPIYEATCARPEICVASQGTASCQPMP